MPIHVEYKEIGVNTKYFVDWPKTLRFPVSYTWTGLTASVPVWDYNATVGDCIEIGPFVARVMDVNDYTGMLTIVRCDEVGDFLYVTHRLRKWLAIIGYHILHKLAEWNVIHPNEGNRLSWRMLWEN